MTDGVWGSKCEMNQQKVSSSQLGWKYKSSSAAQLKPNSVWKLKEHDMTYICGPLVACVGCSVYLLPCH